MRSDGLIGARVSRIEDVRLLTGRAQFIDDVRLPGMLEAAILRSPLPHARIASIDVSRAAALPGVYAVVTGVDVKALCGPQPVIWRTIPDMFFPETYALAVDKVTYPGQGIAAVAAKDRATAEDALELIDVQYEELPAVSTLEQALAQDAPRLFDEWPSNVLGRMAVQKGDADTAFAEADVVLSADFRFARQMGMPLETRGVVATWDPFIDRLDVWLTTQAPNIAQASLGEVLGLPVAKIRVRTPDLGGGFGNKFDFYGDEVVACVLSRQSGKPVKLIEDRAESFVATVHSREQKVEVEIAARDDGTITGMRGTVYGVLGGALGTAGLSPCWVTAASVTGPYDIATLDMNLVGVATNRTPYGSFRGYGLPKANFIYEHMVEKLAKHLGMPAHDVRRKNFIKEFPYQSPVFVFDSGRYEECLDLCLEAVHNSGWQQIREDARSRGVAVGIGYSFQNEVTGLGPSRIQTLAGSAHSGFDEEVVRIDSSGHVTVYTGLSAMGQGIHTTLAQVAAHTLGVPLAHVTVLSGDTDSSPYSGYGTGASRGAPLGGAAVRTAATRLKAKVLRIAGYILEASPDDLDITDGIIAVKGVPDRTVTMAEIGDAAYRRLNGKLPEDETPTLEEREVFDPVNVATAFGCTAVLAEVDRETGVVTLLGYLIAHDCGTVINPLIVDGQLHGGAAQAIGGALYEELVYDGDGRMLTRTFADYLLPSATEVPPMTVNHMATPADHIPGGFKGMGESGVIGGGAAIVNAIVDALPEYDLEITSLPITPPRLLAAMRKATG
ncbi:xanthine dehydrogenase family protein molybdopterin-binding subunit [Kibdelosporangium philippinense]|uniref:Xanthine dehydrogenase family protein molybdopterin-binding subunit n=1 Tax=Kibdelosporangium philippinense TaxID=211113 RepID=A0ABS8Z8T4_9PSEU|nr:xanthine dehydrogenase family protein molybdopterin-binding subunit [Kibdelosporangium philippinense]MCE7003071.1 xanthine dehydrogenase family protein molybdopterin-binding subunit [Kibdelosporangium philippinense]